MNMQGQRIDSQMSLHHTNNVLAYVKKGDYIGFYFYRLWTDSAGT